MATNLQIYALRTNADLLKRIEVAIAKFATYIKGNAGATAEQKAWAFMVFEGQRSADIAQAAAWEIVNNPTVRDAADVTGLADEGAGSLQSVVEPIAIKYGWALPTIVQREA